MFNSTHKKPYVWYLLIPFSVLIILLVAGASYFILNQHRNRILGVHNPQQGEGIVDRHTILEAERARKATWCIELKMGSLEISTLRVVQPIIKDSILVGYIELGDDIGGLLQEIYERIDIQIIATVFKENIDQQKWIESMAAQSRETDWDMLKEGVILFTTLNQIPRLIINQTEKLCKKAIRLAFLLLEHLQCS